MATNTFLTFFDKADGESTIKGHEKWVEVQSWRWGVHAESSWTKGGGASVGKPAPEALIWTHAFDPAAIVILGAICSGKSFPKAQLQVVRTGGDAVDNYFTISLEGLFITSAVTSSSDDGKVVQEVEMIFKSITIDYKQTDRTGRPTAPRTFSWDIPSGTASPSA